jgi:HemY protein
MRKLFVLILIALLLGVGIVAVIETDPGYVLLSYGNYTLETSLWVGLLLLLVFTLLVYGVVRLTRKIFSGQNSLLSWLGSRKARQSSRLTSRGLISFIEGNWSKARRQLLRGARNNETPLLNYLMAARASYALNEPEKMREYLSAAEDSDSEAGIAVELTQAELKLAAGQYEQALATLVRARRNAGRHPHVLDLMCQAYDGLQDWKSLSELLPELKKYQLMPEAELLALNRKVHTQLLREGLGDGQDAAAELHQRWKTLPADLKRDGTLLNFYVAKLIEKDEHASAEKVLTRALKQDWDSELVRLFGLVKGANVSRQLALAEGWLSSHKGDPLLMLTLGRLSARNKLWGKARDYFESSYKLRRSAEVCAELGRLLAALGETRSSGAYFREGLLSHEADLPDLPLPIQAISRSHQLQRR